MPVPTVRLPRPGHKKKKVQRRFGPPSGQWMWAYLTSYCPGTAGWMSASGVPVFYGMLANDYYRFGTRVYIPVLGMTGVVDDRFGGYLASNYFDVWSPVCYSTPTGWFKVSVLS
jgi:hypothetical protein